MIGTRLSTSRASDRGRSFGSGLVELAVISMINTSAHARVVHVTAAVYSGVSRATRAFFFFFSSSLVALGPLGFGTTQAAVR